MALGRDEALASAFAVPTQGGGIAFGREFSWRVIDPFRGRRGALLLATIAATIAAAAAVALGWLYLPAGAFAALAVLFLAVPAGWVARLATAKRRAEAASIAKTRLVTAVAADLRQPLRNIARAGAALDRDHLPAGEWDNIARMRLSARAILTQLDEIRDCLALEDGTFAPETRPFDLYRLANGAVAALRAQAAERGVTLALRIDPSLPHQLRGWPQQLRQILVGLLTPAVQRAERGKLRMALDAAELQTGRVRVRISVAGAAWVSPPSGLVMIDRLARLMGGRLAAGTDSKGRPCLAAELPFEIDASAPALPLDLAHLPVLIATKDQEFVGELVEPLDAWRADLRWIGAGDAALDYLAAFDAGGARPLLIVDGRRDVLQALSFAHRAASLPEVNLSGAQPPYLLFVADEARRDGIVGLADDDFDGILPAPFTPQTLRGVLHAMGVEPAQRFLADAAAGPAPAPIPPSPPPQPLLIEDAPGPAALATVTALASHPRFAADTAAAVNQQALDALWTLGHGGEFFQGVIDAFRGDSARIAGDIGRAVEAGDARYFTAAVNELRRCAANLGAERLCDLLQAMREPAADTLRRQGEEHRRRVEAELARIDAALVDYLRAAARQGR
jgi:hypothetical protein